MAKNESALALNQTVEKINELEKFVNNSDSTPSKIKKLAFEVSRVVDIHTPPRSSPLNFH